jgi:hypothetical protein
MRSWLNKIRIRALTARSDDAHSLSVASINPLAIHDLPNHGRLWIQIIVETVTVMLVADLKKVARGFAWFEDLTTGRGTSVPAIARQEGVTDSYVCRLIGIALDKIANPGNIEIKLLGSEREFTPNGCAR